MGQRIRHFANSLTCSYWHHYFQEKLQKSKLGHLILLQHFMGQRIRHFVNCKLPNPFPLTSSQQNLQDKKHFWKIANTKTDGSKAYISFPKTPQPVPTDPSLLKKLQTQLTFMGQMLTCFPENSPTHFHWPQSTSSSWRKIAKVTYEPVSFMFPLDADDGVTRFFSSLPSSFAPQLHQIWSEESDSDLLICYHQSNNNIACTIGSKLIWSLLGFFIFQEICSTL